MQRKKNSTIDVGFYIPPVDTETAYSAALTICRNAASVEEARELLDMMGITKCLRELREKGDITLPSTPVMQLAMPLSDVKESW